MRRFSTVHTAGRRVLGVLSARPGRALWPLAGIAVVAAMFYGVAIAGRGNVAERSVVRLHQQTVLRHPAAAQHSGMSETRLSAANPINDYVHPDIATPTVDIFPEVPLANATAQEHVIAEVGRPVR